MGEIRSPYFSYGGDYLGDNVGIHSPYFSYGTRDYHGDNAQIHSSYYSDETLHGEDAEIHSETCNDEELYNYIVGASAKLMYARTTYRKCIYRVPEALRNSMGAIYTPRKISIGPVYHDKEHVKPMEAQKVTYFKAFCNRLGKKTKGEVTYKLWKTMEEKIDNIHGCYDYDIQQSYEDDDDPEAEKKFKKMVLLDAIFILEYLLRYKDIKNDEDEGHEDTEKYKGDPILSKMRSEILWDLMLLENQLPFFILEELYGHLFQDGERNYTPFQDLACAYFNRCINSPCRPSDIKDKEILHFTDLVRSLLSFSHPYLRSPEPIERFYRATQLHQAGIKFKRSQNKCLLDIKFTSTKSELSIPCLKINSYTECIFGNLIALEQRHYQGEEYICHYIKLFDTLIAKPKDANLLIKNKIISISGNDGAAAETLIKKLAPGTSEDYSCYYNLYKQLDYHYKNSWTKNSAYFRETYFGNLWKGTATVSAALLLLLTFVQAICSVLSLL